ALAVNVAEVATPLPLVVAVFTPPAKLPLAPVAGAVKVTVTPATGLPPLSFTVATSGAANAVLMAALCGVPLLAVIEAGVPEVLVTVTVTMLEVEVGYAPLPRKVAVTELAPDWSADPGTDSEQVPALKVQLPSEVDPAAKLAVPVSAGGVSTYPVGVPPATVAVNSVDWLEVMEVGKAWRLVVLVNAVFHWVIRL